MQLTRTRSRGIAAIASAVGARRAVLLAGCLFTVLAGCHSSTGPTVSYSMAGVWTGSVQGANDNLTMRLTQTGTTVSGTSVDSIRGGANDGLVVTAAVGGATRGTRVALTLVPPPGAGYSTLTYSGTFADSSDVTGNLSSGNGGGGTLALRKQ